MTAKTKSKGLKKVLRGLDMTLFSICAIIVLDTLGASASIGASTINLVHHHTGAVLHPYAADHR